MQGERRTPLIVGMEKLGEGPGPEAFDYCFGAGALKPLLPYAMGIPPDSDVA